MLANARIASRLMAGFALMMVIVAGLGGLVLVSAHQSENHIDTILRAKSNESDSNAIGRMLSQAQAQLWLVLDDDQDGKDHWQAEAALIDAARARMDHLIEMTLDARRAESARALKEMISGFAEQASRLKEIKAAGQRQGQAGKAAIDETNRTVAALDKKIEQLSESYIGAAASRTSEIRDRLASATTLGIAATVGSLLLGFALALTISRSITRPIGALTNSMRRLADRDMSADIPGIDRRDELGSMALALQVFKANMAQADRLAAEQEAARAMKEQRARRLEELVAGFEAKIGTTTCALSARSVQLETTATSMTRTADTTSQQASAVAAAAEEAGASVQTVAAAAEQLAASIAEISRQVAQSAKATENAVAENVRTDGIVKELADSADKIGNVVALIADIAGQTNLLALNATIEAARAGDAGKGFSVVASEVKSLATQTARATDDIRSQIDQIQGATRQTVAAIKGIGEQVRQIGAISVTIASAVEQQGTATSEIARSVQQASVAAQDVTANITGVSEASRGAGSVAGDVLTAATELSQQAERLSHEVDGFIAGVRAA